MQFYLKEDQGQVMSPYFFSYLCFAYLDENFMTQTTYEWTHKHMASKRKI